MLCNDQIRKYSGQWSFLCVLGFFFLKFLYLCMYVFNVCEYVCGRQIKLEGVSSLLLPVGSGNQTQVTGVGNKHLRLLSHLSTLL